RATSMPASISDFSPSTELQAGPSVQTSFARRMGIGGSIQRCAGLGKPRRPCDKRAPPMSGANVSRDPPPASARSFNGPVPGQPHGTAVTRHADGELALGGFRLGDLSRGEAEIEGE